MFVIQLAIILLACHFAGYLAERLGQCRVIGEIAAGILLGPSLMGQLIGPGWLNKQLYDASSISWLSHLADIGLIMLMFQVGVHVSRAGHKDGQTHRYSAFLIAICGFIVPFVLGTALALASQHEIAPNINRWQFALFCGLALSVSALPVMTRIIEDLRMTDTPVARITLRAAVITDMAGWLFLGLLVFYCTARGSHQDTTTFMAQVSAFVAGFYLISSKVVLPLIQRAMQRNGQTGVLPLVMSYVLVCAWATAALGFHCGMGALMAGYMMKGVPGFTEFWERQLDGFVRLILLPVFFTSAGIKTQLDMFQAGNSLMWLGLFILVAFIGKLGGAFLGARLAGIRPADAAVVGAFMNTRGLMELIVIAIGLQLGLISQQVYTILLIMALVVTATTTPLVRRLRQPVQSARLDLNELKEF